MNSRFLLSSLLVLLLTACNGTAIAASSPTDTPAPPPPPTGTATVTPTFTLAPTFTASPSPTTTRVVQGPDAVIVPILLYHRIAVSPIDSQYYVPPEKFEAQMKLLRDWEYTVIPIELLVKAIKEGAELPPRPIIITFDDGDLSVYTTAFPIMQKYGLTGVVYIVGNYMNTDGYLSAEQIKELAAAGWEVGSHSRSHRELPKLPPEVQREEIVQARIDLQEATGSPVTTFAYPFGLMNNAVGSYVHFAGYIAAMGLGFTSDQGKSNLYWLQRRDVKGQYDIKQFAAFLPWQGDPVFLPADAPTSTATATHTPIPPYTQYPTRTP
ncbi:MAG: hypothetical protein Fur0043_24190 [Anaerolineales bacterium]